MVTLLFPVVSALHGGFIQCLFLAEGGTVVPGPGVGAGGGGWGWIYFSFSDLVYLFSGVDLSFSCLFYGSGGYFYDSTLQIASGGRSSFSLCGGTFGWLPSFLYVSTG